MDITWLAQSGFMLQSDGTRLAIDPYLSDCLAGSNGFERMVPPPLTVQTLQPNAVFCSHDHPDHLDPETLPQIASKYPRCMFLGPASVAEHYRRLGIGENRITHMEAGSSVVVGQFSLIAVRAFHTDPHALGLLVTCEGRKLYFTGDTEFSSKLAEDVQQTAGCCIDLAAVCINGKLGNMNWHDAVELMTAIRPKLAVPVHYGMFAANTADPLDFVNGCHDSGVAAATMEAGVPCRLEDLLRRAMLTRPTMAKPTQ